MVNSSVRAPGPLPPCNDDMDIPSWDDLEIPPIEEDVEIPTIDEEVFLMMLLSTWVLRKPRGSESKLLIVRKIVL